MDENTVVSALNLRDDHGNEDFTCAQLWINIANNCHSIVINTYLLRGYYELADKVDKPGFKVMRIIDHLTRNSGKSEFLGHSPAYSWAAKLPSDDAPIVVLAVQSNAVLVTSDSRLMQKLDALKVVALKALTPKAAVPLTQGT